MALLTRCYASTYSDLSTGTAAFSGTCSGGRAIFINAASGSVLGGIAGLSTAFVGSSRFMSGRIGSWRATFSLIGHTLIGRYGGYRVVFEQTGGVLVGRIGSAPVSCYIRFSSLPASILCVGKDGGAEALLPVLAALYVSGE